MESLDTASVEKRLEAAGFARATRAAILPWVAWITGGVAAKAYGAPTRFHVVLKQPRNRMGLVRLPHVVFSWKQEDAKDSDAMIVVSSEGAVFILGTEDHRVFPSVPETREELDAWKAAVDVVVSKGWGA